jgi:hypothetical protein
MKTAINFNQAILASLSLIGFLILFHLSIITGILFFDYAPTDLLWSGRMKTAEQLLNYEIASVLTTVVFLFLVLIKSKRLNTPKLLGVSNVAMWVLFVVFSLNTIGNLMAKTTFEKFFAIVSGLLAFLLLRIALERITK